MTAYICRTEKKDLPKIITGETYRPNESAQNSVTYRGFKLVIFKTWQCMRKLFAKIREAASSGSKNRNLRVVRVKKEIPPLSQWDKNCLDAFRQHRAREFPGSDKKNHVDTMRMLDLAGRKTPEELTPEELKQEILAQEPLAPEKLTYAALEYLYRLSDEVFCRAYAERRGKNAERLQSDLTWIPPSNSSDLRAAHLISINLPELYPEILNSHAEFLKKHENILRKFAGLMNELKLT